ncbi:hypothetical protein G7Z17_g11925 [Cylindrodendrum hubeiense]|uniref:Uncharacterized protein n=1 Tax=Cylindrodendrum hubeiense TaxID=595255 RepID=A0A9P5GWJ6_9HYPO|nr:hypothetical protein G7Z17_g11925 [Cylindrodendrum hubeiense]
MGQTSAPLLGSQDARPKSLHSAWKPSRGLACMTIPAAAVTNRLAERPRARVDDACIAVTSPGFPAMNHGPHRIETHRQHQIRSYVVACISNSYSN